MADHLAHRMGNSFLIIVIIHTLVTIANTTADGYVEADDDSGPPPVIQLRKSYKLTENEVGCEWVKGLNLSPRLISYLYTFCSKQNTTSSVKRVTKKKHGNVTKMTSLTSISKGCSWIKYAELPKQLIKAVYKFCCESISRCDKPGHALVTSGAFGNLTDLVPFFMTTSLSPPINKPKELPTTVSPLNPITISTEDILTTTTMIPPTGTSNQTLEVNNISTTDRKPMAEFPDEITPSSMEYPEPEEFTSETGLSTAASPVVEFFTKMEEPVSSSSSSVSPPMRNDGNETAKSPVENPIVISTLPNVNKSHFSKYPYFIQTIFVNYFNISVGCNKLF